MMLCSFINSIRTFKFHQQLKRYESWFCTYSLPFPFGMQCVISQTFDFIVMSQMTSCCRLSLCNWTLKTVATEEQSSVWALVRRGNSSKWFLICALWTSAVVFQAKQSFFFTSGDKCLDNINTQPFVCATELFNCGKTFRKQSFSM